MHRAPDPTVRIARWVPFAVGALAVVVLLAVAAAFRFAGTESETTQVRDAQITVPPSTSATTVTTAATTVTTTTTTVPPSTSPATSAAPAATPDASGAPTYGGTVAVGVVGELLSLNPFGIDGNTDAVQALTQAVSTGAIRLEPTTLEPEPFAVEELPSVENGGLEVADDGSLIVRLQIRDDATWADGTPISAADFIQTYDVARLASGVRSDVRERYSAIVTGSVTGEGSAVEYRLREPGLAYLDLFDVLVPAHEVSVSGFSTAWTDTLWPAGGPFRLLDTDPETSEIRLVANQRSWLTSTDGLDPLPYLDGLTIRFYPTRTDLLEALRAGDVQVARVGGDPGVLSSLGDDERLQLDVQRGPGWEQLGFQFSGGRLDANPGSVTGDVAVRRAVAALIDRPGLAEEVHGAFGRALDSPVELAWPAVAAGSWSALEAADVDAAAELLTEIVAASEEPPLLSFATTANDPAREALARRLVDALEPLGFIVEVTRDEPGAYFLDRVIPGEFELAAWAWESSFGPAGAIADLADHHVVAWPDGTDFYRWGAAGDSEFEPFVEEVEAALAAIEVEALAELLVGLEERLAASIVLVPLYAELNGAAADATVLAGFRHSPLPGGELAYVGEWWSLESP